MTAEPLVLLESVKKTYGKGENAFHALRGVDMDIAAGEFVALMGASGSGKSTAMNIIGCIDSLSAGRHSFKGRDVGTFDRGELALLRRQYFGFVFQNFNLLPRTSALENVALPLLYRGVGKRDRISRATAALDLVGLEPWRTHTPAELSGGQQQRVAIARALVSEPALLLADEPTGNLDSERSSEIMALLVRLNRERGVTILMVTHELAMASFADKIIFLNDGLVEKVQSVGRA
jgi:putative ABC transport system ATP-binding protein